MPLIDRQSIELQVVGPGTRRGIEEVARLVKVMHDRRLPVLIPAQNVARQVQCEPETIAVVVVRDVFAPIGQARPHVVVRLVVPIDVDHPLPTIHFRHRHDDRDHVLANRPDHRRLFHRQPVGQLHQHLRRSRLRRVESARQVVDGLGFGRDSSRFLLADRARIGQPIQVASVPVQVGQRRRLGDDHLDHLPPFLARADRTHLDPRGRGRQGPHVPIDLVRVVQDVGRADDLTEVLQRRRYRRRARQVVDQVAQEARIRGVALDAFGVLRIVLRKSGRSGDRAHEQTHDECNSATAIHSALRAG